MALPSLQRTQIMDIYLFGFIIFTIGSLVVTILVMYGHSHKLHAKLRDMDDDLHEAWNYRRSIMKQLEERVVSGRKQILKLQKERLACVYCTPTLKKKA